MSMNKPISETARKAYMNDPNHCPHCECEDVTGGPFQSDSKTAWQSVTCNNCNESWNDIYTLTDIEEND
jgi:transposase-like protein